MEKFPFASGAGPPVALRVNTPVPFGARASGPESTPATGVCPAAGCAGARRTATIRARAMRARTPRSTSSPPPLRQQDARGDAGEERDEDREEREREVLGDHYVGPARPDSTVPLQLGER